mgnify:CR=1 FL=1
MYTVIGPDVSFYQDNDSTPQGIDFGKLKENSSFVIIRVGQNSWIDSDFKTNWAAAKQVGLPRGSYWFYDSRTEPQRQAELWADALKDDPGELPLCADFEENYGGPHAGWRKWYTFLEHLKNLMPEKEIVIYTAYFYWTQNAPSAITNASSLEYFRQYPLWIANYNVSTPSIPAPWGENDWLWWQYTAHGDGALYGVESKNIDLNYFNGDLAAFRARFKLSDIPSVPTLTKYKVELSLRDGPAGSYSVVGTLAQNDLLEKLDQNEDGTWFRVRRDDGLLGWLATSYLIAQEDSPVTPPANPWAKVLPEALNVRSSDSYSADVVGILKQGQVVWVLEYNTDQSWVKVLDVEKQPSGEYIVGWCDTQYFTFYAQKPEPPQDPPVNESKWFLVTAYALNVRKGPGTQYEVIDKVMKDDVVEQLEVDETNKWFKIRTPNAVEGWASAYYLVETEAPVVDDPADDPVDPGEPPTDPPTDPPSTDPVIDPTDPFLGRFQVTAYALNLREGPSTSYSVVSRLVKGDVIIAIESTEDGGWRKVQKDDGVEGWCSAQYLVRHPTPIAVNQKYFSGAVRHVREIYTTPRKMIVNVLVVDTKTAKMKFLVTPPTHDNDAAPLCGQSTSEFLKLHGVQFAINGDGYQPVDPESVPGLGCADDRELLNPNSYAASRGTVYSQRWENRPVMYINANNEITYNEPKGVVYNAISGDRTLVDRGAIPAGLDKTVLQPRTAIGTNTNGRWMILIVVDGRQPGYSEGCTLYELAEMMIKYGGVHNAINLDGGGSSVMVIEKSGEPDVVNSPIEGGIAGRERLVANHFGIEVK